MENHATPSRVSGAKSGSTPFVLSPPDQPPPWTRTAAANGPAPSGRHASSFRLSPPARLYSMSGFSPPRETQGAAATFDASRGGPARGASVTLVTFVTGGGVPFARGFQPS